MTMHRFGRKMHFQPHYQKIHQLVSNISVLRIHGCAILTNVMVTTFAEIDDNI